MVEPDQIGRGLTGGGKIVDVDAGQFAQFIAQRFEANDDRQVARLVQLDDLAAERRHRTQQDHPFDLLGDEHFDKAGRLGCIGPRLGQNYRIAAVQYAADAADNFGKQPVADLVNDHEDDVGLAAPEALRQRIGTEVYVVNHLPDTLQRLFSHLVGVVEAPRHCRDRNPGAFGNFDDRWAGQAQIYL